MKSLGDWQKWRFWAGDPDCDVTFFMLVKIIRVRG